MTLIAVNFNAEIWRLTRFLSALLQPVVVLLLIIGLVLLIAHFLTMMGTRWGDHRTSSKAMFFSVAMHLMVMVSLVAMIPEYRALQMLSFTKREFDPIRIQIPEKGSLFPSDATASRGVFSSNLPMVGDIPLASDQSLTREPQAAVTGADPLARVSENLLNEPSFAPDVPQQTPEVTQTPEQSLPAESSAAITEPQPGPQVIADSLPVQYRNEQSMISETPRTSVPNSISTQAQSLSRPDTGISDRPSEQFVPDRQSSAAMVLKPSIRPICIANLNPASTATISRRCFARPATARKR